MLSYEYYFLLLVTLLIVSCGTMTAPKTSADHLAYAIAAHEGAVRTVTSLLQTDQITVEKAKKLRVDLVDVRGYLDSAVTFKLTGDILNMENRIMLANTLLLKIQANLEEKPK